MKCQSKIVREFQFDAKMAASVDGGIRFFGQLYSVVVVDLDAAVRLHAEHLSAAFEILPVELYTEYGL